jgi:hypothetical protein
MDGSRERLDLPDPGAGVDGFAEKECAPYHADKRARPSLPPGCYFRMHLVGYFEGIDSEHGLEWRCAPLDYLSARCCARASSPSHGSGKALSPYSAA